MRSGDLLSASESGFCLMQHRIFNKFSVNLVFSLLVTITVSAMTVSAAADNTIHQQLSQYSLLLAGGQSNPWALPQAPENTQGFQHPPQDRNQQYLQNQTDIQYPGFRFVTPEILESLKQQQMQSQRVTGDYLNRQYNSPQSTPPRRMQRLPAQEYYGYPPPAGTGSLNPLYDVPAVSPWSNGPDVLYQGESFPWLPDAAIGGIPSIPVQPFPENNENRETGNVFNPFSFGSNGNL